MACKPDGKEKCEARCRQSIQQRKQKGPTHSLLHIDIPKRQGDEQDLELFRLRREGQQQSEDIIDTLSPPPGEKVSTKLHSTKPALCMKTRLSAQSCKGKTNKAQGPDEAIQTQSRRPSHASLVRMVLELRTSALYEPTTETSDGKERRHACTDSAAPSPSRKTKGQAGPNQRGVPSRHREQQDSFCFPHPIHSEKGEKRDQRRRKAKKKKGISYRVGIDDDAVLRRRHDVTKRRTGCCPIRCVSFRSRLADAVREAYVSGKDEKAGAGGKGKGERG